MRMLTAEESEYQRVLERLLHDLQSKSTLCCAADYPGVTVEELNTHVHQHGPLQNAAFGEMHGFWVDDGYLTPYRNVVPGCCELAPAIAMVVRNWDRHDGRNGSLLFSRGAYIFDERTGKPTTVRTPNVTYIPRRARRPNVEGCELWQYGGEPYAPSFVAEIDYLSGENSQLDALDSKMRSEYFRHGVQLGWLIDPREGCRKMLEYKRDDSGEVYCVDSDAWRDLDGGAVLPGLKLSSVDLEMALDGDAGALSSDDDFDAVCPYRGCDEHFQSLGRFVGHVEEHRAERARKKYLAKKARRKVTAAREHQH
jgi:Uma2 family endonuclease